MSEHDGDVYNALGQAVCLRCGEMPDTGTVVDIMKRSQLFQVKSESTFVRRSSTIVGWIRWVLSVVEMGRK